MENSTLCAALAGGAHIIEAAVLLLSTTFAPCILLCQARRGAHRSAGRLTSRLRGTQCLLCSHQMAVVANEKPYQQQFSSYLLDREARPWKLLRPNSHKTFISNICTYSFFIDHTEETLCLTSTISDYGLNQVALVHVGKATNRWVKFSYLFFIIWFKKNK